MKKILIASLTAVIATTSVAATAADQVQIAISHDGLDLSKASDVAIMRDRIEAAVATACAKATRPSEREACVRDGTEKAMSQLEARSRIALAYTNTAG
ncbi:UrcA family protein [Aurantiacibacter flavus]|uniref:UrcA family protein n=1 Tax=Aurantiacibacter flavus TaxID=3145232 RepID=A0ABV0CWC4_9SPHN